MNITQVSQDFSTAGQIQLDDLADIQARGFQAIVCARPDGEGLAAGEPQPSFAEVEAKARTLGMVARYVPVAPTGATEEDHERFSQAIEGLKGPILGYCRSGMRAGMLWQALQDA